MHSIPFHPTSSRLVLILFVSRPSPSKRTLSPWFLHRFFTPIYGCHNVPSFVESIQLGHIHMQLTNRINDISYSGRIYIFVMISVYINNTFPLTVQVLLATGGHIVWCTNVMAGGGRWGKLWGPEGKFLMSAYTFRPNTACYALLFNIITEMTFHF